MALGALIAIACGPARATLGGDRASVEDDRLHLQGSVARTDHFGYAVNEIRTPNQGLVREYVSAQGLVFAITWHGPFMPNLRQVLGPHYTALGASTRVQHGGLGHFSAHTDEVAFNSNGRMRSFHGSALLMHQIPSGVTPNDLR